MKIPQSGDKPFSGKPFLKFSVIFVLYAISI